CWTCTGSTEVAAGAFGAAVSTAVWVTGAALLSATSGFDQPSCPLQQFRQFRHVGRDPARFDPASN
ncbi:MAG: hypothetical protein WA728_21225, partial [Xanthobacteraceae bacterium]